ncbi:unnamed protein product [Lathyrus sativus]|nr:unnamed protein product [Lathyrus sativus]
MKMFHRGNNGLIICNFMIFALSLFPNLSYLHYCICYK